MAARYDERGNRIEATFFDASDAPALNAQGFAPHDRGVRRPGARNEVAYFGPEDKPAVHQDGCAAQQPL